MVGGDSLYQAYGSAQSKYEEFRKICAYYNSNMAAVLPGCIFRVDILLIFFLNILLFLKNNEFYSKVIIFFLTF